MRAMGASFKRFSIKIRGITYQLQSIDPFIFLDVLGNVSIYQPGADDAKQEQRLRDPKKR